jgi:hypothetical protein
MSHPSRLSRARRTWDRVEEAHVHAVLVDAVRDLDLRYRRREARIDHS